MSRRALAGLAGATVLLLSACGASGGEPPPTATLGSSSGGGAAASTGASSVSRVFQTTALQDGVRRVLTQSYGLTDVAGVRCPDRQAVQIGISFDCEVMIGGVMKTVTLTVQTADGTYAVAPPK